MVSFGLFIFISKFEGLRISEEVIILDKVIITPLLKAQKTFESALKEAKSDLERGGAIQRFEYTYELIWKILKKILSFKGINANSPRDVFREAAKQGLYEIIKEILKNIPDVCLFDSRVTGKSKRFSDLDICLKKTISDYDYEILKEKFENSDLPFKADLVEYNRVSDSFKEIID